MKAAVINQYGEIPHYDTVNDPTLKSDDELVIEVKASAISPFEEVKVSGKHAIKFPELPAIVGSDCVGVTPDGRLVYALGQYGTMAEKAIIKKTNAIEIPHNLDPAVAAALPVPLFGSDVAIFYRSGIKEGDTVLINGATGAAGNLAVQLAKFRGASKVIAVGRDLKKLEQLRDMGADVIIGLGQPREDIRKIMIKIQSENPINIILDYLWAEPIELLLSSLSGLIKSKVKLVSIGSSAGETTALLSQQLRVQPIEIVGSGLGSVSYEELIKYNQTELPKIFELAAEGKIKIGIQTVPIEQVSEYWDKSISSDKRLVFTF